MVVPKVVWSELDEEQRMEMLRLSTKINSASIAVIFNCFGVFLGVATYLYLNFWTGVAIMGIMVLVTFFSAISLARTTMEKARWIIAQGKGMTGTSADAIIEGLVEK